MKNKGLKPMAIKNNINQTFDEYVNSRSTFSTSVEPRLTDPVQPFNPSPSNRRILVAVGMALGCGLTLLFELFFGG